MAVTDKPAEATVRPPVPNLVVTPYRSRRKRGKARRREIAASVAKHTVLIILSLGFLFPLLWMISTVCFATDAAISWRRALPRLRRER